MRIFLVLASVTAAAVSAYALSPGKPVVEKPTPELPIASSTTFSLNQSMPAFSKRSTLPAKRKAPHESALFVNPSLEYLGRGFYINPRTGQYSLSIVSRGSSGRWRSTLFELSDGLGYTINTRYTSDQNVIRTRVRVRPDRRFETDPTNLTDDECIDTAIAARDLEEIYECIGLAFGKPEDQPQLGFGRRNPLGSSADKDPLDDYLQSFEPPQCEDGRPFAPKAPPPPKSSEPPKKIPDDFPLPTTPTIMPLSDTVLKALDAVTDVAALALSLNDGRVLNAANRAEVYLTGVISNLAVGVNPLRSAIDAQIGLEALANQMSEMNAVFERGGQGRPYRFAPIITKGLFHQITSRNEPDGSVEPGLQLAQCDSSSPRTGPLWDNDEICGDRTALECLGSINDPVQFLTEGKCATVPGQNDQPMLMCRGRDGEDVGQFPPKPDPDECGENDLCWTDPNTGPTHPRGVSDERYIDLVGIDSILVGICAVGGCPKFPDRIENNFENIRK
ncbi:MAG: hypothetical protein AAF662_02700 [Pseudomonadota bacterium]